MTLGGYRFVGHQVPLVDAYHQAFPVALDKAEYVGILTLNAPCGINHKDADVAGLYRTNRANHAIVFDILVDFLLFPDARRVDEIEIEAEFIVAMVD